MDWTLVPYVRKSFFKHYRDGLKYIENIDIDKHQFGSLTSETPIDDKEYKRYNNVYEYALAMTEREAKQSAEALIHNLNTLQSRSGNQLKMWLAI